MAYGYVVVRYSEALLPSSHVKLNNRSSNHLFADWFVFGINADDVGMETIKQPMISGRVDRIGSNVDDQFILLRGEHTNSSNRNQIWCVNTGVRMVFGPITRFISYKDMPPRKSTKEIDRYASSPGG